MIEDLYTYNALVTNVYDGDSIDCLVDLGFSIKFKIKVKLEDLNAPEMRGEEREAGLVSRDALREKIFDKEIIIKTKKDKKGKYGRFIATIFLPYNIITETEGESGLININEWLIENDYAVYRKY